MQEADGEVQDKGEQCADEDSEQATDHAERYSFKGELHHDRFSAGADGLADADLARPLSDADEHDVHDAYAADDQADAGDRNHKEKQSAGDLVPQAGERLRAEDGEVIILIGAQTATNSHEFANLYHDEILIGGIIVFDDDPEVRYLGMDFA